MKRGLPLLILMFLSGMSIAQTHTIKVTVPDTVEIVYIAGTINNWNPASDTMTMVSSVPKMYAFEFEAADTTLDDVKYKFLSGPAWKYEQKRAADFSFLVDSATAVVDTFKAVYHKDQADTVTISVLVPANVIELNLTGSFNGWDPTSHPMEQVDSTIDGKEFTATIFTEDTTTLEFKFVAGPGWPYQQTVTDNYIYMEDGGTVVCMDFEKIFDPNELGNITINITVPQGTAEVWLIGSFNNWETENAIQATKNEDNTFTAIVPNVADIEYKAFSFPDWPYEEAKDETGTSLDVNRTASFVNGPVYDITVAFWKQLYIPTATRNYETAENPIYVRNKSVVVEDVTEKVTVYDIQGRIMQDSRTKGTFTSKTLQTGVYIIRVDNRIKKVLIH